MDPLKDLPQTCADTIIDFMSLDDIHSMNRVSKHWHSIIASSMKRTHVHRKCNFTQAFDIHRELNKDGHVVDKWYMVDASEGRNPYLFMVYSGLSAFVYDEETKTFMKVIHNERFYIWKIFYIGDYFYVLAHQRAQDKEQHNRFLFQLRRKVIPKDNLERFDLESPASNVFCKVNDAKQVGQRIIIVTATKEGGYWNYSEFAVQGFITEWNVRFHNLQAVWDGYFSKSEDGSSSLRELYESSDFLQHCESADFDSMFIGLAREWLFEGKHRGQPQRQIDVTVLNGVTHSVEVEKSLRTESWFPYDYPWLLNQHSIGGNYVVYRLRPDQAEYQSPLGALHSWRMWNFNTNAKPVSLDFLNYSFNVFCYGETTTFGAKGVLFCYSQPKYRGWFQRYPNYPSGYYSIVKEEDGTVLKQGMCLDPSDISYEKNFLDAGDLFFVFPARPMGSQFVLSLAKFMEVNESHSLKEFKSWNLRGPAGHKVWKHFVRASRFGSVVCLVVTWKDKEFHELAKKMVVLSPKRIVAVRDLPLAEGKQLLDTRI